MLFSVFPVYLATDTREETPSSKCVVKLTDLRAHPELSGAFNTRFKQLANLRHEHLMEVYDVGIHFENGFIAMESGLQSLEQLLIKRGTGRLGLPQNWQGNCARTETSPPRREHPDLPTSGIGSTTNCGQRWAPRITSYSSSRASTVGSMRCVS